MELIMANDIANGIAKYIANYIANDTSNGPVKVKVKSNTIPYIMQYSWQGKLNIMGCKSKC